MKQSVQVYIFRYVLKQHMKNTKSTLQEYLALPRITNNHYRSMPNSVKNELIMATPGCMSSSLDERMQWLREGRTEYPKCKECGESLSSKHWYASITKKKQQEGWPKKGYSPFCSRLCAARAQSTKQKYRETSLSRYGVTHPLKSEEVQAKRRLTNLEKYGSTHPHAWNSERFREIVKSLHGVEAVRHISGVDEKIKKQKQAQTQARLLKKIAELEILFEVQCVSSVPDDLIRIDDHEFTWVHTCGREYTSNITFRGIRSCPRCSTSTSKAEREIGDWLEKQGLKVIRRDRTQLGIEVDIYLPEKKIAIEYDGTYWHSARFVSAEKTLEKLKLAEKSGVKLITIQEHQYFMRKEQVISRLRGILGFTDSIHARKTTVAAISNQEGNEFFKIHHLQGGAKAQHTFGLFYNGELVAAMSFGKPRFTKKARWEIIRFANKSGVSVVGGASKLLKRFRSEFSGSILSYADRSWSSGDLYRALGFRYIGNSAPSYFWVSGKYGIFTRYQTQKKKLLKLLPSLGLEVNDALTEEENMTLNRFLKMYDKGNSVWILEP